MSVFPDAALKSDEILVPKWLVTQLKDKSNITLIQGKKEKRKRKKKEQEEKKRHKEKKKRE